MSDRERVSPERMEELATLAEDRFVWRFPAWSGNDETAAALRQAAQTERMLAGPGWLLGQIRTEKERTNV